MSMVAYYARLSAEQIESCANDPAASSFGDNIRPAPTFSTSTAAMPGLRSKWTVKRTTAEIVRSEMRNAIGGFERQVSRIACSIFSLAIVSLMASAA